MLERSAGSAVLPPADPEAYDWRGHAQDLLSAIARHPSGPVADALDLALQALGAGHFAQAVTEARAALSLDVNCVVGWRLLGLGHEGERQFPEALSAFQAAYTLEPQSLAILSDLGRLAMTLDLSSVAVELFARALILAPQSAHVAKQLSMALRDGHQYGKAIEVLTGAIANQPLNAFLRNALASVLLQQGDTETALTVVNQALERAPQWSEALYNRAIAKLELGDLAGAETDCDAAAAASPDRQPAIRFVQAQAQLAAGDLEGGWRNYDARLLTDFPNAPSFELPGRRWDGRMSLKGARVLLVGEQGIGDEIMFSGLVCDVAETVGQVGALSVLAAPRLVSLFRRSFPGTRIVEASTQAFDGRIVFSAPEELGPVDLWIPMGSLGARWRRRASDFARRGGYLKPDPQAVARWRKRLSALDDRPKVGLSWKSMKTSGNRLKQYPSFEDWRPVLSTSSVRFVNLQYGDCELELQSADIWRPPGLDLTRDIDGSAALSASLDLVIGVGNASSNLAAAVGTPTWFVFPPTAWPRLGTDHHPWFALTRGFGAARFGQWGPVLTDVAAALGAWTPPTTPDAKH